jgi:hypothetical protein
VASGCRGALYYRPRLGRLPGRAIWGEIAIVVTRHPGLIVPDERKGPLPTRSLESGRGRPGLRDLTTGPEPIPRQRSADRSGAGSIR